MLQKKSKQLITLLAYARASKDYAKEAALLPRDRSEKRKSMLYFLFIKLPVLSAGIFVCGTGIAAYFIYRMFTTSRLGQQIAEAAGDAKTLAAGVGNALASKIQAARNSGAYQRVVEEAGQFNNR
jgi:hypothetical protein